MDVKEKVDLKSCPSHYLAAGAVVYAVLLHVAWVGAWVLARHLELSVEWMTTTEGRFTYWLIAKALLWLLPAFALIRASGRTFKEVMGFEHVRSIFFWGGGIGLLLGAITLAVKLASHQPLFSSPIGLPLFSGVLLAPLFEEYVFRGAVLGALNSHYRFFVANTITALLFLGIHLPGWFFQGCLVENLLNPVGGALSIFLLGWVFGFVTYRSKSVAAGTVTHILNNLFNA